jgi:uncharacterized membrane protein
MAAPKIGECLSAGIDGLKKNPIAYIVGFLMLAAVNAMTFSLLLGPLWVGYMRMVKIDDEGGKAEIGDLFKGFDDLVPALVAGILSSVIVFAGTMLCIVPGILVAPIIPTSLYLVATGEKDGVNAVKRAWKAISKNLIESFACGLVLNVVGMVGFMLCCVGIFVTLPITFIGNYHMAKQLTDGGTIQ